MKVIEDKLLDVIKNALKSEHESLLELPKERFSNSLETGIFHLPEKVLVYVIYKKLLQSTSFRGLSKNWEDWYSQSSRLRKRHKYVDLMITDMKSGMRWDFIECGWYTPKKVEGDYKKLKDYEGDEVNDKYLVLFRRRTKKEEKLDTLIEQTLSDKNIRECKCVCSCRSFLWEDYPIYNKDWKKTGSEPRVFEIALFKID